jgi:hypothetical protein
MLQRPVFAKRLVDLSARLLGKFGRVNFTST